MKKFLNLAKSIIIYLILIYIALMTLLYFFPQLFLYIPSNEVSNIEMARRNGYPAKLVEYKSEDGTDLYGWHTEPEGLHKGKIIVFMHGNALNIEAFFPKVSPFNRYGYATFMPEYRGFGGIKGKITDKNLVMDALAAVKEANKLGYKNEDIIVYGFSLGSHMAVSSVYTLKEQGKFEALVLEVPFNTLPSVVKAIFPVYMPFDILIRDKYDNISLIPYVDTRVLIMATKDDGIVPYYLAEDLYNHAVEPKDIIIYDAGVGHNDLYDVENFVVIRKWLEGNYL
ncbi:MAG: alpha/beta hydrolase [Lactobacillaceae bacterium]|jgi:fermentation-respiration switch protein FrsA (DUF1100 family)|nr:alpha/beta hydrolase [Lactobacillaceae bacterium]